MRLGGLSTNLVYDEKIIDLKDILTFLVKKIYFNLFKKIFIKVKQFGNIRGREIHSKLISFVKKNKLRFVFCSFLKIIFICFI